MNREQALEIRSTIGKIQKTIEEERFVNLRSDNVKFMYELYQSYPEFGAKYPSLLRKIAMKEPLDLLDRMLNELIDINDNKKKIETVERELGMELGNKYIHKK